MIRRLMLNRFGKFEGAAFDFKLVTVFCGDNEAGKTTIWDAIFYKLCEPSGTKSHGKRIKSRYGENLMAELQSSEEVFIDEDEFLNIYAIHAGDIAVELDKKMDLLNNVKAKLFAGGIDPAKLVKAFEDLKSDSENFKHNKELKRLKAERVKYQDELGKRVSERDEILQNEGNTKRLKHDIEIEEKKQKEKREGLEENEKELRLQEKIRERQKLSSAWRSIEELKDLQKDVEASGYKDDRSAEITAIDGEINKKEIEINKITARKEEAEKRINKIESENSRLDEELTILKRKADESAVCLRMLLAAAKKPLETEYVWSKGYLVSAGIALIAGLLLTAFITDATFRIICGGAGVLFSAVFLFMARKMQTAIGGKEEERFVMELKEQWKINTGGVIVEETSAGLSAFFNSCIADYNSRLKIIENNKTEARSLYEALNGLEKDIGAMNKEKGIFARKREEWLNSHKVQSKDEYIRKAAEYRQIQEQYNKKYKEATAVYGEAIENAGRDIDRRLKCLDEEGIPSTGMPDEEFVRLRRKCEALRKDIDEAAKKILDLNSSLVRTSTMSESNLENINKAILKLEQDDIPKLNKGIAEIEMNKKAASIASEVFADIQRDTTFIFEELAKEVSNVLEQITSEERKVAVTGLDSKRIEMQDAGGALRQIEHLSSGTHDTFMFAMRLALAKKSAAGQFRLLVLDEPFLYMDSKRTNNALELLKSFQNETQWQIIIFTKEKDLSEMIKKKFSDISEIQLSVG